MTNEVFFLSPSCEKKERFPFSELVYYVYVRHSMMDFERICVCMCG